MSDPARSLFGAESIVGPNWEEINLLVRRKIAARLLRIGVNPEDVEDLAQDTLLFIAANYDPGRVVDRDLGPLAYASEAAKYAILEYFRKRKRNRARQIDERLEMTARDEAHDPVRLTRELIAKSDVDGIHVCRKNGEATPLAPAEKDLLMRVYGYDEPYEEVQRYYDARGIKVSVTALRARVSRLKRLIRESWQRKRSS